MAIVEVQLTNNLSQFAVKINLISNALGDVALLSTGDSSAVSAINTIKSGHDSDQAFLLGDIAAVRTEHDSDTADLNTRIPDIYNSVGTLLNP
jgi:hypothetical protein